MSVLEKSLKSSNLKIAFMRQEVRHALVESDVIPPPIFHVLYRCAIFDRLNEVLPWQKKKQAISTAKKMQVYEARAKVCFVDVYQSFVVGIQNEL